MYIDTLVLEKKIKKVPKVDHWLGVFDVVKDVAPCTLIL